MLDRLLHQSTVVGIQGERAKVTNASKKATNSLACYLELGTADMRVVGT
jgi:hypothetical protein